MKRFLLFIIFFIYGHACSNRFDDYQEVAEDNAYFASLIMALNRTAKSWAFPIYMGAANNLEAFLDADVAEMLLVGSNARINVTTQEAKNAGTRRYYIEKNNKVLLNDLGIVNSADKTTLEDFCRNVFVCYPFSRLCLILWDHGYGPIEPPFTAGRRQSLNRSLLRDDNFPVYDVFGDMADVLSTPNLVSALSPVVNEFNRKFDVLAFNACQMMSIEILSAVKPYCNYVIGSEVPMYACGFAYDLIFSPFVSQTYLPIDLCRLIVQTFEEEALRKELSFYQLSAAYADENVTSLEEACGIIGDCLYSCLEHQVDLNVVEKIDHAGLASYLLIDVFELPDAKGFFLSLLGDNKIEASDLDGMQDPDLLTNLESALTAAANFIGQLIFSKVSDGLDREDYGLSIYLPILGFSFYPSYETLNFADNHWWRFVEKYASY